MSETTTPASSEAATPAAEAAAAAATTTTTEVHEETQKKAKEVLVVGGDPSVEWTRYFEGRKMIDGTEVHVTQCPWEAITMTCYSENSRTMALVSLPSKYGKPSFTPDLVLVRSAVRASAPVDYRNVLLGFAFAGVPCVNSAQSLYLCQEKPLIYAALRSVRDKLGADKFPLIEQTFYPSWRSMTFPGDLPVIAKISTVHAGLGKMKIDTEQQYYDLRSVVAMSTHYLTTEPCIDWDYDFRIQKIGPHVRGFRRTSDNWKGQGMGSRDADEPVSDLQLLWLNEVSSALGMDVLTIDGVHDKKTGKDYIVEVNDSAIGLNVRHKDEDFGYMVDLVMSKLEYYDRLKKDKSSGESKQPSTGAVAAPPATANDPSSLALEAAQKELTQLRAKVASLEADLAKAKEKKGFGKFFS